MASPNLIERDALVKLWEEAWADGLWAAAWGKALDGLSPEQAAWQPGPGRHCVWEIVNHLLFWREYTLRTVAGDRPAQDEVDRRSWAGPAEVTAQAWAATQTRFAESHQEVLRILRGAETRLNRFLYHLPHDSYHIGQIMYLRALLGLSPVE
jgi:hypothetical protein